jgi:hypothetical protein
MALRTTFTVRDGRVVFSVADYPAGYEAVLRSCYYARTGEGFEKSFPLPVPRLEQVQANFAAHLDEMLAQLGGMRPARWEDALLAVGGRLSALGFDWWLTGSCAARIRGVTGFEPHDVDVMLDARDAGRISDALADWIIEPIIETRGWVTSHFGVAFAGARVDLAFGPQPALDQPEPSDSGPYAAERLELVGWRGLEIKAPPLELQMRNNARRNRMDRAAQIAAVLAETTRG